MLRRTISGAAATALLLTGCATAAQTPRAADAVSTPAPATKGTVLTLLGTAGGPGAMVERAGIASLLTIDGTHYLIDAGDGVTRQLARAKVAEPAVSVVFLTHLHDDHTAGLPALATFAYTLRSRGLKVVGPVQTRQLVDGVLAYMAPNVAIRRAERRLADPAAIVTGQDVPTSGQIYSDGKVTVTAVENTHFRLPAAVAAKSKSLSYRFQTPDRVIAFTGDTGPSPAVAALAKGADVLVCEIVGADDIARAPPDVRVHMLEEHLSPTEAGRLATRAGVKMLVLSHLRSLSDADVAEVKRNFSGRVVIGRDLDTF